MTLLLTVCSGAWAAEQTYTVTNPATDVNTSGPITIQGEYASSKKVDNSNQKTYVTANGPLYIQSKAANIKSVTLILAYTGSGSGTDNAIIVKTMGSEGFSVPSSGVSATLDGTAVTLSNIAVTKQNASHQTLIVTCNTMASAVSFEKSNGSIVIKEVSVTYDDAVTAPSLFSEGHFTSTTEGTATGGCSWGTFTLSSTTKTINEKVYYKRNDATAISYNLISGETLAEGDVILIDYIPGSGAAKTTPITLTNGPTWSQKTATQTEHNFIYVIPSGSSLIGASSFSFSIGNTDTYVYGVQVYHTSSKAASSFALTSDEEVEVAIGGTSNITSSGAAGTLTYASANEAIATVSASGVITGVAGGKTTITITDSGNASTLGGSATVTVLVPYEAVAADSYVFKIGNYKFANSNNTKYYFDNGFTMTVSSGATCQYAALESNTGIKYSHARQYTINVPDDVTVTYAVIKARNNYKNENDNPAANWGTVFGTSYSSETLPWSTDDAVEKDFVVETPAAGADLTFQPGGNQWQAIITLYTIAYHDKYTVSFDKGDGTGSMDDVEVRGGSTYTLPASTFTAPSEKGFAGWLCNINEQVYAAGESYTMTDANTTFTAQYEGVEGKMIIKAVLQSASKADITGAIGGSYTAGGNVQNRSASDGGCKLGKDGTWVAITLNSGWTFKEGDIVKVNIGTGASGTFAFYKDDAGTNAILTTTETGSTGLHTFVLPAAAEDETSLYLVRKSGSDFNPYVDYIEVIRPDVITLNASGFATYSRKHDFEIYSGATAYAMALDIDAGTLTGTAVEKVPAGAGVLLKGEAGASVSILETTGATELTGNSLHGTTAADGSLVAKGSNTYYVLSGDTFMEFTGSVFVANRAYFEVASGTVLSRSFSMVFEDGETTGISASLMNSEKVNSEVYNLNGQRVMNPAKGLYIVNGRKVVIK